MILKKPDLVLVCEAEMQHIVLAVISLRPEEAELASTDQLLVWPMKASFGVCCRAHWPQIAAQIVV